MKIMFVANYMWDIYIFRFGVLKALVEDGYEVIAVAPDDGRVNLEKLIPGIKTIPITLNKRGINPIEDIKLINELYRIYKTEKPDLIFHYTIKPNIYGTIASKLAKRNSIAILTGLGYSFIQRNFVSKIAVSLYKFSLQFSKEIWVLNDDDKNTLLTKGIGDKSTIFILPGEGTDCKRFSPLTKVRNDDKIIFLMIARAFIDKGFKEYEESARRIKNLYKDKVEFWYLGALGENAVSGITKDYMDNLVNEGVLKYLGITDNPENIIKECDVIVLPSYREGISKTLLEGAAMGKPLIASNVTGCKEIIEDNKTGFLVNVKDIDDLSNKMKTFINLSNDEKENMGKLGREKILKEFDEKIIIEIYKNKIKLFSNNKQNK